MDRFWSKVDRRGPDECWPWKAAIFKSTGYGQFRLDGTARTAHSVAWELANGQPMPAGKIGRHTCDNRPCCNPAHVLPGTHQDNVDDMWARRRARIYGGQVRRGEDVGTARLTEAEVLAIRQDRRPLRTIAAEYGINWEYVSKIRHRRCWRHLP